MGGSGVRFTKGKPPLRRGAGRGAFGRYLAIRDERGQFQSTAVQRPIEIRAGGIFGVTNITASSRAGVISALVKGLRTTIQQFMPTVPKDTGAYRRIFKEVIAGALGSTLLSENTDTLSIAWDDIEQALTNNLEYAKYHITTHPDFNPAFAGGYADPTTAGTKPIDPIQFMNILGEQVDKHMANNLNKEGLDAR